MTDAYLPYPKIWEKSTLEPNKDGPILSVVSGGTPSTEVEKYWDGNIFWLTPKEICNGNNQIFISKTKRCITDLGLKNSGARLLPPRIVLLTKRAPVGEAAVNTVPMSTNQGFLNFQCNNKMDPLFLYFWFKANKPYLIKVANGSTYKELYISDLFEFVIGYPPIDEQKRIVNFLLSLRLNNSIGKLIEDMECDDNKINKIHKDNHFLKHINEKILLNVMSGKVEVNK